MQYNPKDLSIDMGKEDRYSRLRLIPWWDQDRLARAKVMVVGSGALGNEVIKNLALLGTGTILIVDFDVVETSNLSRSVLFRPEDEGKSKADAAARAAMRVNPDCRAIALEADVTSDVGLGLFRWADVVICGPDNREARLAVNRACWKVNRPWVDGATESIQGIAKVFQPPDGACYECTLGEHDLRVMAARDSCGFLAKQAYRQGHVPTTPTISAVIAGVQVQEAVKLLHPDCGLPSLAGKGFFFDGSNYECFTIQYSRREDCLSHETFENVIETSLTSEATLADVAKKAAKHLRGQETLAEHGGAEQRVVIDLPGEMVTELRCSKCRSSEEFYRLARSVTVDEARCPSCGEIRTPEVAYEYSDGLAFGSRTLSELGFGIMDVLPARRGDCEVQIEISGDAERLFGAGCD